MSSTDGAAGSAPPPRKRAKYVSEACSQCRQRKVKCNGEAPCHNCKGYGEDCSLTNKSATSPASEHSNAALDARLSALERQFAQFIEQQQQQQQLSKTSPASHASPPVKASESELFRASDPGYFGRSSLQGTLHNLIENVRGKGFAFIPPTRHASPGDDVDTPNHAPPSAAPLRSITVDSIAVAFPTLHVLTAYLHSFFTEIHPLYPALDERHVRETAETAVKASETTELGRAALLDVALLYAMFAITEFTTSMNGAAQSPPGWEWYEISQVLLQRVNLGSSEGNIAAVQTLLFQALYLSYVGRLSSAYMVSSQSCSLIFQLGLHLQTTRPATSPATPNDPTIDPQSHFEQSLFWTAFLINRRISLSCGRPYSLRELDFVVGEDHVSPFMVAMAAYGRLSGTVWDALFAAKSNSSGMDRKASLERLDQRIVGWAEEVYPSLFGTKGETSTHVRHQKVLVEQLFLSLRLLLRRSTMAALEYDAEGASVSASVSISIINSTHACQQDFTHPGYLRIHFATVLGTPLICLAALILRPPAATSTSSSPSSPAQDLPTLIAAFKKGSKLLDVLADTLPVAKLLRHDVGKIAKAVTAVEEQRNRSAENETHVPSMQVGDLGALSSWDVDLPSDLFSAFQDSANSVGGSNEFVWEEWFRNVGE